MPDLIADVVGATEPARVDQGAADRGAAVAAGRVRPGPPLHRAAACLSLRTFTVVVRFLAPRARPPGGSRTRTGSGRCSPVTTGTRSRMTSRQ